jgi:hypothetical protein
VLSVGNEAATVIEFLFAAKGVFARSSGTALKVFRKMHQAGELDRLINDFKLRVARASFQTQHRCTSAAFSLPSRFTPLGLRCVLQSRNRNSRPATEQRSRR